MTTLGKPTAITRPAPLRAPALGVATSPAPVATFESEMRMIPGVHIGLRSMYVEAAGTGVLVSPVGTAEEERVVTQRAVTLVAPSLLHHLHLPEAIARYHPDALWGPPGLAEKKPELGGMRVLGRDPWPFAPTLDFELMAGAPARNEVVFFHAPSRTIYTADVVFHVDEPQGLLAPIALRAMGVYKRFAMPRPWRLWVKDRAAFQASLERVLAWDFDRIVMAHGAIVETRGRELLLGAARELGLYR